MSRRLTDFLIQLSTDAQRLERFEADPNGTMDAAGLSAEERQAVISRNPDVIRKQLGQLHLSSMTDRKPKKPTKKPKKKKAAKKK